MGTWRMQRSLDSSDDDPASPLGDGTSAAMKQRRMNEKNRVAQKRYRQRQVGSRCGRSEKEGASAQCGAAVRLHAGVEGAFGTAVDQKGVSYTVAVGCSELAEDMTSHVCAALVFGCMYGMPLSCCAGMP